MLSNILNNQNLTDAHTCYKMFKTNIFLKIKLEENDFSFCPEITTKLGKKRLILKKLQSFTLVETMTLEKKLN